MSSLTNRFADLSPERRMLLLRQLSKKRDDASHAQIDAQKRDTDTFPLSFAQQRLWFLDQLEPGSATYLISKRSHFHDTLIVKVLEQCMSALIVRHESLRTTFHVRDGEPVQVIHPPEMMRLPVIDLQGLLPAEREAQVRLLTAQEALYPCDLEQGPLMRIALLRLGLKEHVVLLTMHHIISDRWSNDVFMRELTILYRAFMQAKSSPLPPLPVQYADFAIWQRQWLHGEVLDAQLAYWKRQLANITPLDLPLDYPRPPVQTFRGAGRSLLLPMGLRTELEALSRKEGATLFMTLLAAFQVLLMRYSGQTDIVIGTAIANRTRKELEGLIGFFANTLVLRVDLAGNPGFKELLGRVREVALAAYSNQDIPFEQLVAELQPERDLSRSPLFQISFSFQQAASGARDGSENAAQAGQGNDEGHTAKVDLLLVVAETPRGLICGLQYRTDLFATATITRFLEHWQVLLQSIVSEPQTPIASLALLSTAERQQILVDWNATEVAAPIGVCAHQIFELQVRQTPDAIAVVDEQMSITYAELDRRANQLAWYLQAQGVTTEDLVGVYVERSTLVVLCLLAILKAGGGYVPLDPAYPRERLAALLADAQVALVLTQDVQQVVPSPQGTPQLCLPEIWSALAKQPTCPPVSDVQAENVAYVIYTSGSTGMPKGVQVTHRGIGNLALAQMQTFGVSAQSHVLQFASLSFDASIFEMVMALLVGGNLFLSSWERLLPGPELLKVLEEWAITVVTMPPSALAVLPVHPLPSLECMIVAGEACSAELVARWAAGRHFYNAYGPTETTVWASVAECVAGQPRPPIGSPIANTQVYVLDRFQQPVPIGVPGELHIGGIGLARGYLHRAEITAERFVPHPFSQEPGARLYKTGDQVFYQADGTLTFLGRLDEQVKVRGYRIELGEIEAVLLAHPQVRECRVLIREDVLAEKCLVAYVVEKESEALPAVQSLRRYLQENLPDYMVPAFFVKLNAFPVTPNGKVDRRALPLPEIEEVEQDQASAVPQSPLEELLATIWQEVLGRQHVGVHENFFEVGGHSLLAAQLISRMRTLLNVEMPLRSLFEVPTIAGLAQQVELSLRRGQQVEKPPLRPVPRTQDLQLSFAQQRLWFLDQLEPESTAYLLPSFRQMRGKLNIEILERSLSFLVQRHESLRTTFPVKGEQPIQLIQPLGLWQLPVIDLMGLAPHIRGEQARLLIVQEGHLPCDLARGPLMRVRLLQLAAEEQILLLTVHHIISDGRSNEVLRQELATLYQAFERGEPSPLPPLPIQYADFAAWQRKWLQGAVLAEQLDYWRKQLAQVPPLSLPTDYPRPAASTFRGAGQAIEIAKEVSDGLTALGRREGVTLFMIVLATFQVLLMRSSGQTDIAVGTPVANRQHRELEGLIGFFVNVLVIRTDLSGNPSFLEVLRRVREVALGAYGHQDIPFEQLVAELQPERDLSRSPLFQVSLSFQQAGAGDDFMRDGSQNAFQAEQSSEGHTAKVDLSLAVAETPGGLRCRVQYRTDLFASATITRFLEHWQVLLQSIVTQPQTSIGNLPLLSTAEQQLLLVNWNATRAPVPVGVCAHQLFELQVKRTPDAIAVVDEQMSITYAELERRANQLAWYLQAQGVTTEDLVGVYVERSTLVVLCLLAILKAGGGYVPLDPAYPRERLAALLADAQVALVLTQDVQQVVPSPQGTPQLCLPEVWSALAKQPTRPPVSDVQAENVAYVIYTSGSTGMPKGVQVTHRGIGNMALAQMQTFGVSAQSHVLQFATLSFDASIFEMAMALLVGGSLFLSARERLLPGPGLLKVLEEWAITVVTMSPSALAALPVHPLPCLKCMIVAGEVCSAELVTRWAVGRHFYNAYGPTETTVWASVAECVVGQQRPPIGSPIANTQVYVLDRFQQPVPIGVPGELHIGGIGLARGYLHRAEITAERFVPHPFSQETGARLYKTGDQVLYQADGKLIFLGRLDEQVKIRGYRIELGEIEAVINQHPEVRDCVVVVREETPGDQRLVAYLVENEPEMGLSASELRPYLQEKLPDYMVPATFVILSELPLTPSGKADRRALPSPEARLPEVDGEVAAPRTPIEEAIEDIWCEVLGDEQVGIHENFFDLGGHSILATQLIARVQAMFQVEMPVRSLFEAPTIAELAQRVEQLLRGVQPIERPPLLPVSRMQDLPLSFAQQRLWFLDQLESVNTAYLIPGSRRMRGRLDVEILERSLYALQLRHESLRTVFPVKGEQPIQLIQPPQRWQFPVIDLTGLASRVREEQVRHLRKQEAHLPCDLARGPLMRVKLLKLEEEERVLLFTMHHIISDGRSNEVLWQELVALYQAFVQGKPAPLPPLPIQYADFAVWQRQWLQGEVLSEQLDYWRKQLVQVPPIDLPTDYPRPAAPTFRGAGQAIEIAKKVSDGLMALSRREGATLFMTLLAAFQVLLMRYSGQTDIAVGTPVANRQHKELEGLIGFFVNVLVMRTDLAGNPNFLEVLRRVREVALGAYGHQDIPFEQLVAELQPERDLSRSPLFQISFSFQQEATGTKDGLENVAQVGQNNEESTAKEDLLLAVTETAYGLRCRVQYRTDLFNSVTITRLLEHWQVLLQSIVSEPQIPVAALALLSATERQRVLIDWNATKVALPAGVGAHQLFERQVMRTPDAIAVVDEQMSMTYAELDRRANQLAWYLQAQGVTTEDLVGVYVERSTLVVLCLLAILKAGGGYVPLDPAYPRERLAALLADAQVALVLTQDVEQVVPSPEGTPQLCLPKVWSTLTEQPTRPPVSDVQAENVAYVIYTSGSTGTPKGVQVTHRGIGNLALAQMQTFGVSAQSHILQFASLSFDASISELVMALFAGASLFLSARERLLPGLELLQVLEEWAITVVTMPPSALAALPVHPLSCLECLIVAGEACAADLVTRWAVGRRMYNAYGPTESTVCASIAQCVVGQPRPPIGRPIANTQVYVLDRLQQPVPIGVPGELYLGGIGQARGYLHRPEVTAERFVPHPLSQEAGARLYKTGDLVRYRADGLLEFLGRNDEQVKIRGYRIELGEIETVINQHPEVRDCVVVVREETPGDQRLVAYLVENEPKMGLSASELRPYLQEKLPDYMVPATFVILSEFPLTPSGKVDRRALPSPEARLPEVDGEVAVPRTPIEEAIAAIWCEVLGDEQIGIHENFFDLGGHSLLAAQLMTRVQAVFQVELVVRSLFEAPTIAGLAQRVEQQLQGKNLLERPPLLPVSRTQDIPLSFAQQRLWFLAQLEPESTVYLIPSIRWMHGKLNVAALERSLYALQQRHESLRTTFPTKGKQPIQLIQPMSRWQLPVIDLTGLAPHVREEQAHRLIGQEAHLPCDLVRGPLMRVRLLQLDAEEQILLLTMHHIISDGWSSEVLWRELVTLYQAFIRGEMSPLPPLPIQYADFAVWQRQWLQGVVLEQHLAYWRTQLDGIPPLELPTDHLRPPIKTYRGAVQSLQLPISLQEKLSALSQREQVTLFMLLLAAFQVLLARYSGQQDIAVGTPIANRTDRELEGLIGFFVNTLVMRTQVQDHLSFTQLLGQVREVALAAYTHQDVPFEYLVEMLHPERDLSRSPFFQIMFTLQQQTAISPQSPTVAHPQEERTRQQKLPIAHTTTKFDLTLNVMSSPQGLSCGVEYNTDLFEATTIQQMLAHWKVLLEGIAASPDAPLATLPLLTEDERQRLIRGLQVERVENDAPMPFGVDAPMPVTSCLHGLFEQQVALAPDAIALVFEDEQLTYDQLNIHANQLAYQLRAMGVQAEELIGICLERSLWLPVAILGILKAGGAYVPLDPSYPPERLAFMLTDAGISKVVTMQKLAEGTSLKDERLVTICFDADASTLAGQACVNGEYPTAVDQLAYVIYTSGSTGIPKGVLVSHANVMRLFSQTQDSFQFRAEDVWTLFHSSAFDFSVWELWGALLYGGRLVIVPYWVSRSPAMFSNLLQQQRVTILNQTPSAFYQLLAPEVLSQSVGGSLRLVIFGGEALEAARLQPWVRLHGCQQPHLVNMYGITETTVHVTLHFVTQEEVETSRRSMIGEGIADLRLYVLDRHRFLVPAGVAGELYVGGMGVARGYLGRAELTSERFVPDPFSGQAGARLYRTGDRVRARSDGKLEYLGRVDQQVKIRGYRIELGEIEQVLREYEGVGECAVVVREKGESGPQLLGYVVPTGKEKGLETGALRKYLQKRLPEYMVPGQIVLLERLPLSPNGKLDRRALPAPEEQSSEASVVVAVARTPIEEAIAEIWYEVLGNAQIGIHENFFERGGHSLLAAQLVSRVQAVFQVGLPIRSLFEAPTIAGLAQQVEQLLRGGQYLEKPPLLPVPRTQDLPLSFAQQRLWLIDQLEPGNTAYLIVSTRKLHGFINAGVLERSFEELVQRHESLRTTFHVHEGHPVQRIHPAGVYCLPVVDLCGLVAGDARAETRRLIAQEAQRPFDLSRDPSLRTLLVHAEPQEYMLLLTMHHINFDGWSSEVLFRELTTLYKAFEAGQPSPLRPLPIQYADYALWQRQWLQGEVLESHLAYWMRQLSGMQPLLLPTDHPRSPVQSHRGLLHTFVLPEDLSQALIALSRQEGTTLFMTLLAAFQILFYRYSGQQDIAIGADIAGRNQVETEGLIGFFINLLVLRTRLAGAPSFREVLQRVREMVLQAYTYQETPFELVVEKLAPQHSINSMPLIQALFVMQSSSTVGDSTLNAGSKSLVDEVVATKFDMALFMGVSAGQIHGGLNYSVDLFEAHTIQTLLARFEVLLKSIVMQPDTLIDKLDFLTEDEQAQRATEEKLLRNELRVGKGERFDL